MMITDSDWLDCHQQNSTGNLVVFYTSIKNRTTNGYKVLVCACRGTKEIVAVGEIKNQSEIHQNEAWVKYGSALGALSEEAWRRQAKSVLENSLRTYGGQMLAIELVDFRFFAEPVIPNSIGIQNTGWQSKKEISAESLSRLIALLGKDSDLALAHEFGLESNDAVFLEGKQKMRLHLSKERNRQLVNRAKKDWIEKYAGKLQCEICEFSFNEIYGDIGTGYIEAHHRVPIASLKVSTPVKISDLVPVCANCHRMLHRRQPLLTTQALKEMIKRP